MSNFRCSYDTVEDKIIEAQAEDIAKRDATIAQLVETLKVALSVLEHDEDYIPEEGYDAYLSALSIVKAALEAAKGSVSDE